MATNPTTLAENAGRITAASGAYPFGSSQDETAPGAGDGTPYKLARANDIYGMQQALLALAGITPSGNADSVTESEYVQAIMQLASGRAQSFDESGAANAYVLDVKTNQQIPEGLFDGQELWFIPANTQTTAACTLNPYAEGVLSIKKPGGVTDPEVGTLVAGLPVKVTHRTSPSPHYEIALVFTSANTIVASNYIIFPNGFKIQWGADTASTGSGNLVNFTIAFTTVNLATGNWNSAVAANLSSDPVAVHTESLTQVRLVAKGLGAVNTVNWIAVGF